ncbi:MULTISPECIES: hypothetical protein [unclassified Paenibacillus]|uniref:hypothetical protein n=1 Tax=unclassified Paenibacillus TaxID=185978 RepID=UPI00070FD175|nr:MULTISPECIES: hypothetical protein [unclassified Paenibacillus]KQX44669.1 hypothetical protein ASD40_21990 [Paenibacillus sp. Root444D2]KRE32960.1 hypothetical protein ASG85_15775 [Paenibacillus sp. Soil724D2]
MEYVKAPTYPMAPMPMPTPMPAPMPMPMPTPMPLPVQQAPIMQSPVHNDIHLHASYQQTSYVFPKPVVHHPVAKVSSYNSVGSILVLFILLVIITRGFCKY